VDAAPDLGHLLISLVAARHLAARRVEFPPFSRLIGAISRVIMLGCWPAGMCPRHPGTCGAGIIG
jgi:hypothetical protein